MRLMTKYIGLIIYFYRPGPSVRRISRSHFQNIAHTPLIFSVVFPYGISVRTGLYGKTFTLTIQPNVISYKRTSILNFSFGHTSVRSNGDHHNFHL